MFSPVSGGTKTQTNAQQQLPTTHVCTYTTHSAHNHAHNDTYTTCHPGQLNTSTHNEGNRTVTIATNIGLGLLDTYFIKRATQRHGHQPPLDTLDNTAWLVQQQYFQGNQETKNAPTTQEHTPLTLEERCDSTPVLPRDDPLGEEKTALRSLHDGYKQKNKCMERQEPSRIPRTNQTNSKSCPMNRATSLQ